jgi:hypothetical protein
LATKADVAELVDARDLKSLDGNVVWVRVPPPAPLPDKRSEEGMPDENDDLFGEDADEAVNDFNRLVELLFQRVSEFADEEDVADDILPLLLLQLSVTMRMMAYAVSVAKPSGGGLKLDLDRFRRDAEELIREMKKDADRFIARIRESMTADEPDGDES